MLKYANMGQREVVYQVGDNVYLKIQPHWFRSLARQPNKKLSPRFYGLYVIIEHIDEVAYYLAVPREHLVFHIS